MLVKASLEVGAWWLAASVLVSGFLTTIAFGRVFLFSFWRPVAVEGNVDAISAPAITVGAQRWRMAPILILTGFVVWFGLFPDSLIVLTQDAASRLLDQTTNIRTVLPEGAAPIAIIQKTSRWRCSGPPT